MRSLISEHEPARKPEDSMKTLGVILEAINLYWDNIFEFQNSLQVNSHTQDELGKHVREQVLIQRIYDTAYYLRCEIIEKSRKTRQRNEMAYGNLLETIELRILPTNLELGMVNVKHIKPNGSVNSAEIAIAKLPEKDPTADGILERLELNILSLLIGHCVGRDLFDPLPIMVKTLLTRAYGKHVADELWNAGIPE